MPCWHRMPALSAGATNGSPTRARESIRVQSRAARPGWPTGGPAGRPRRRARPDVRAGRPNARTGPGERGGRPSGRHGPGGQSVRTAHGPGGVAGRADGAGGPGGLPAGPGRACVLAGRWDVQRRDGQAESARGRARHACPFFRPAQAMGVRPVRVRPTDASITLRVVRDFQQRGCSPVKTL